MDWFIPPLPFGFSSGQRSGPDLRAPSCCPAGCKKAADMGGGRGKGRKDYTQDVGEMAYVMTGAYRHGKHGHRGYIDSAGWVKVSDSAWLFYVESEWILRAAEHSARSRKPRFEVSGDYIRCIQGHSADAWGSNEIDLDRLYGRAELDGEVELLHGTDVANVEGIVRFGLLPGGGSVTNRVAVHWIEHAQGGAQPGLRSGSTALVTTKVKYLREAGITLYRGSENVILTTAVPSEHLREVFAWNYDEAERGDDLALHDGRALKLIEVEAEVDETGDADVEEGALPTGDTDDEDDSLPGGSNGSSRTTLATICNVSEKRLRFTSNDVVCFASYRKTMMKKSIIRSFISFKLYIFMVQNGKNSYIAWCISVLK